MVGKHHWRKERKHLGYFVKWGKTPHTGSYIPSHLRSIKQNLHLFWNPNFNLYFKFFIIYFNRNVNLTSLFLIFQIPEITSKNNVTLTRECHWRYLSLNKINAVISKEKQGVPYLSNLVDIIGLVGFSCTTTSLLLRYDIWVLSRSCFGYRVKRNTGTWWFFLFY